MARPKHNHSDLTGQKIEQWTVLAETPKRGRTRYYLCRCDCGTEREVMRDSLIYHVSRNCGCGRRKNVGDRSRTHGLTQTVEYWVYAGMKQRCYDPRHASYHNYGGRGIAVCDRWVNDFAAFYGDMGPRPSPKHTLDRRDNDGPYSPDNCYWATRMEQANNNRHNRFITYDGQTLTLEQWSRKYGVSSSAIRKRLRRGWPLGCALELPPRRR